jgi:hypothetical protein
MVDKDGKDGKLKPYVPASDIERKINTFYEKLGSLLGVSRGDSNGGGKNGGTVPLANIAQTKGSGEVKAVPKYPSLETRRESAKNAADGIGKVLKSVGDIGEKVGLPRGHPVTKFAEGVSKLFVGDRNDNVNSVIDFGDALNANRQQQLERQFGVEGAKELLPGDYRNPPAPERSVPSLP